MAGRMPRTPRRWLLALGLVAPLDACVLEDEPRPPADAIDERLDVVSLAGPDLVVVEGSRAVLAGAASRGLTGDAVLAWAQGSGPPVLLTNPSSPLPVFVAPFAPAELTFELRAESAGAVAFDQVHVDVVARATEDPAFLVLPPDAVAQPGETVRFAARVAGRVARPLALTARARCARGANATVENEDVVVTLPDELPCIIVVDGTDADGHGLAPAARVFWPEGTALPRETAVAAPIQVAAGGAVDVRVAADTTSGSSARAWPAGGAADVLPGGLEGDDVAFAAPRRVTTVAIAAERRLGGASGGVRYAVVDVTAGVGNVAPTANGGSGRIVPPGGRFRLDLSSSDLDGDVTEVLVTQVLGAAATPVPSVLGAFVAPAEPGELLFHIESDDGRVRSPTAPVRVLVSEEAENLPPILALPPTRYVTPGETFVVDGSAAEDPDSGYIAGVTISQDPEDSVLLLEQSVEESSVTLVAGPAGESYRFSISAFDEDGAGVTAVQTVFVEEAGPYVDPVRGSAEGTGTAASPFRTVDDALPTALRHALPVLLLSAGEHAVGTPTLPAGMSLRGGLVFDGASYVDGGAQDGTTLIVGAPGLLVEDASLDELSFRFDQAEGTLTLRGDVVLRDGTLESSEVRASPLLLLSTAGAARLERVLLAADAAANANFVVETGATARMVDSEVRGGSGDLAVGIDCLGSTLVLERTRVQGSAADALASIALRASLGSTIDLIASDIRGGTADDAVALEAAGTLVTVDAATQLVGSTTGGARGVALSVRGRQRSTLVRGSLLASTIGAAPTEAVALLADGAQVSLLGASLAAATPGGVAADLRGGVLLADGATLVAGGSAVVGDALEGLALLHTTLNSPAGIDVSGDENGAVELEAVITEAEHSGIRVRGLPLSMAASEVSLTSSSAGVGLDVESASIADSAISVLADDATAVLASSDSSSGRPILIERSTLHARGVTSALAMSVSAPLSLSSSFVTTEGPGAALLAQSGAVLTVHHATIVSANGSAVRVADGATLDLGNTMLSGVPGIDALGTAPWSTAAAVAFGGPAPLLVVPTRSVTTALELADLGCQACLVVDTSLVIDPSGHLLPGENPLVDAGDPSFSASLDIDGESRLAGEGPDIGCDERQ